MLWQVQCTGKGFFLTLYFLLPSKGGSQRLTGGAKHPVGPCVPVPDTMPSVGEVLDPVSGQGQLSRVITVTGVGVPAEVIEGTLQHAKEAIHVPNYKFWRIHWRVPQNPRNNLICCAHAGLFVHFWERESQKMRLCIGFLASAVINRRHRKLDESEQTLCLIFWLCCFVHFLLVFFHLFIFVILISRYNPWIIYWWVTRRATRLERLNLNVKHDKP